MRITVDAMLAQLPGPPNATWPQGARSAVAFRDAEVELRLFHPAGPDRQQPHDRDELYIVVDGRGEFVVDHGAGRGIERTAFGPGDALVVAAHVAHRFERLSPEFKAWVVFYGPPRPAASSAKDTR